MSVKQKRGLGRGFDSLLPTDVREIIDSSAISAQQVILIPVGNIKENPHQPRSQFETVALAELAASIQHYGILQPLVVTKSGKGYELVAGERRLRAAKIVGLETVPAIVREATKQQKLELALIENIARDNLNAIEMARAFRALIDQFSLDQEQLSKRTGKSRPTISNTMRLLQLPEEVQQMVISGDLKEGHARVLLQLKNEALQKELAKKIVAEGWSMRHVESLVRGQKDVQRNNKTKRSDNVYRGLADRLTAKLGTTVKIETGRRGIGTISIRFSDPESLESIIRRLQD